MPVYKTIAFLVIKLVLSQFVEVFVPNVQTLFSCTILKKNRFFGVLVYFTDSVSSLTISLFNIVGADVVVYIYTLSIFSEYKNKGP